ncbi:hypothetical protein [Pseudonocardia acaciae]|uniref:hypothetical protein n=1 Tax=Pseudonocardia acaciae TaxID=551276 RepID=UPI000687D420|nr:hypothetical protein [Pseudonocardia acaciae]
MSVETEPTVTPDDDTRDTRPEPTTAPERPDDATPTPPRRPAIRRAVVVLAVLALAAAVAVAVLGWQAFTQASAQGDRDAALEAARTSTAAVLSYDSKTLDADLAKARASVSGDFAAKFNELTNAVIVPAARQQELSAKATVLRAALIDNGTDPTARPDRFQALVFVNQATTVIGQPQPRVTGTPLKVTLTKVDGAWLITDLQPA